MGRKKSFVVMPAYNEADIVGELVAEVKGLGHQVIVVDDASSDTTASEAEAAGAAVLRLPVHLGAWPAMQTGLRLALRRGAETIVTMDADGQHLPLSIQTLHAGLDKADVVIGACPGRASRLRHLAWRVFRTLTGLHVRDITSGFRAYRRQTARSLLSTQGTLMDYQDMGVLLLLIKGGWRISEVDVPMRQRIRGKSHLFNSWRNVWTYMSGTLLLCLSKR